MILVAHISAIVSRLLVNLITSNVDKVNEIIIHAIKESARNESIILFHSHGVVVSVYRDDKNKFYLHVTSEFNKPLYSKLGSDINPLNKRVLNELSVWLFSNIRGVAQEGTSRISDNVKRINVNSYISNVGLLDRIKKTETTYHVSTGYGISDTLIDINLTVSRSILNRVHGSIEISTVGLDREHPLGKLLPVVSGVFGVYDSNGATCSMNQWVHQAILDHIEGNLK